MTRRGRVRARYASTGSPPHRSRWTRARRARPPDLDETLVSSLIRETHTERVIAQLLVDEVTAAASVAVGTVHERSQPDLFGQVSMTVVVDDVARFRSWLLGLGERAELLAPAPLRGDIVSWLQAISEQQPSGSTRRHARDLRAGARARSPWRPVCTACSRSSRGCTSSAPPGSTTSRLGSALTAEQVVRDLTVASMCGVPPYSGDVLYGFWVDPEQGMVHVVEPTC